MPKMDLPGCMDTNGQGDDDNDNKNSGDFTRILKDFLVKTPRPDGDL